MSPTEALATTLAQNPRSVVIVAEQTDGSLGMLAGPDMSLEHINFMLDQIKLYLVSRAMGRNTQTAIQAIAAEANPVPGLAEARRGQSL